MMAFNPAAAFNAQLLAASQPSTPVKAESSNSIGAPPTSHSDLTNDAIRFLNASGPLLTPGIPGFPHPMNAEVAAFRAAVAQGAIPFPAAAAAAAMYSGMHPAELKPEMMGTTASGVPGFFFDASLGYHPYAGGLDGARRKNATRETTAPLKSWLNEHRKNPYPTKAEKIMLALLTKMTLTQVSTWFANARRRLKKENKMTWSPRNRPGEDDDDDLADIDTSERDPCDRPSSSTSNISDLGESLKHERVSSNDINGTDKLAITPTASGLASATITATTTTSSTCTNSESSPKKTKIWSIAETLSSRSSESDKTNANTACTSVQQKCEMNNDDYSHIQLSTTTAIPFPSSSSSLCSSANCPPGVVVDGAAPLSAHPPPPFLQFNPWQQQMAAIAMSRMPSFPRPDLLTVMAQSRPPPPAAMLFSPLLMGSPLGIMPQPPQSTSSSSSSVQTITPVSTSSQQSNGSSFISIFFTYVLFSLHKSVLPSAGFYEACY
ncbi:unnamed protein product [Anisakis simplex]|uniref:Putative iroquois-class homeodomain protein irx-1 (inferred by orthology to a C. elegans protein) n=1 Tax=Anisakis simplex TaxID=6269 RepID=A0A158PP84_ANISI|nr:unnamed protein product [Anisakis simplex]